MYTPRCVSGFRCYPRPGAELPLQALVQGQGTCERWSDAAEYGAATVEHPGAGEWRVSARWAKAGIRGSEQGTFG